MCLFLLSDEDVEDVCIFRLLIAGILLIGLSGYLTHREIQKVSEAIQPIGKLPGLIEYAEIANTKT